MKAPRKANSTPTHFLEPFNALPLVELVWGFRQGTALDPAGQEGALSIAFRALRRGAGKRSDAEIDAAIDRLGAEFGGAVDVSSASLQGTVLQRNLDPFLELVDDLLFRPTFSEDELARTIRETKADIVESRNDDRTLAARWFRRRLFAGHPFGRPSAGTLASLEALRRDHVVAAWENLFRRDNLVLGAAGALDAETFQQRIVDPLSARANAAEPVSVVLPEPSDIAGRRLLIVDKPERTQTQIYIGSLGSKPQDKDHLALHVANTIFGGTFTARLMQEVRSKRGWSYGASSRMGRDRVREAWWMWTFPAATDAVGCIELQLSLLEKLLEKGITASELRFAKSYLTKSYAFEEDTASKRLGQHLDLALLELPKNYYRNYLDKLDAVSLDDVNTALRKRLSAKNLLIVIVATAKELQAKLETSIKGLAETMVVPYDRDAVFSSDELRGPAKLP